MRSARITVAFSSLFVLVAGCSKDSLLSDPGGGGVDVRPIKLVVTPASMALGFQDAKLLQVQTQLLDGRPAPGREVTFTISGPARGSTLTSATLVTDAAGNAQNQVRGGADKAEFSVVVASGTAPTQAVFVKVDGDYTGGLRVQFHYGSLVVIRDITVRVHRGALDCDHINFVQPPAYVASTVVPGVSGSPVFNDLLETQVYTVTATGIGVSGTQVVTGCAVAPPIVGRSVVNVLLDLELKPQSFLGTYDFATKLHTNEALPGQAGAVIDELNSFFLEPGAWLADYLVFFAAQQTGWSQNDVRTALTAMWLIDTIYLGIEADPDHDGDYLEHVIDYYLLDRAPAWAVSGLTIGGDLTELVKNLTVGGKLEITSAGAGGQISGHWGWSDFLFLWRYGQGCNLADTCCGRHAFSGQELGLQAAGADFTGMVVRTASTTQIEYDLSVPAHRIDLQYGNLLLFGLKYFVLPAITGQPAPVTVATAAESLFGCDSSYPPLCGCARVGDWINGIIGGSGGQSVCVAALGAIDAYFEDLMLSLTYGGTDATHFMMAIDGQFYDADRDLQMDRLDTAVIGDLYISGGSSAFTGEMTGDIERAACVADAACTTYETCQLKPGILNDCVGREVCAARVGSRTAGQTCTQASQCESGTCVISSGTSGVCFSACAEDTDCPSALTCSEAPVSVAVVTDVTMNVHACGL